MDPKEREKYIIGKYEDDCFEYQLILFDHETAREFNIRNTNLKGAQLFEWGLVESRDWIVEKIYNGERTTIFIKKHLEFDENGNRILAAFKNISTTQSKYPEKHCAF